MKTRPRRGSNLSYFYPFSYPMAINGAVSLRPTKRKHGTTLFPTGLFNYRRGESALLSGCTMMKRQAKPCPTHSTGYSLFCLVNRIFAHPCACPAIRGDPRAAGTRESMHIADFQNDVGNRVSSWFSRDTQFWRPFMCTLISGSLQ